MRIRTNRTDQANVPCHQYTFRTLATTSDTDAVTCLPRIHDHHSILRYTKLPIFICPIAIAYSMGQIIQEAPLPRRAQRVRRA